MIFRPNVPSILPAASDDASLELWPIPPDGTGLKATSLSSSSKGFDFFFFVVLNATHVHLWDTEPASSCEWNLVPEDEADLWRTTV